MFVPAGIRGTTSEMAISALPVPRRHFIEDRDNPIDHANLVIRMVVRGRNREWFHRLKLAFMAINSIKCPALEY
jgi:hypothetical protein